MSRGSPSDRAFRRDLRREATDAERAVWWILRDRHLGVKFRRQHTLGPFILDFFCVELRLAIEIDGGQHYEDAGLRHDGARDLFLQDNGVRTLRFSNLEVLKETEGVAEAIWDEIQLLSPTVTTPSPSLSPEGSLTIHHFVQIRLRARGLRGYLHPHRSDAYGSGARRATVPRRS
ncbi:MAG: endonuclease domain-containing protein, partial [Anaeromyxobacteraceae bacterium]